MSLDGNPWVETVARDDDIFKTARSRILEILPNIEVLDDIPVVKSGKTVSGKSLHVSLLTQYCSCPRETSNITWKNNISFNQT